jgi:hypothetical protein
MQHSCKITPENIDTLAPNEVFVFGSNLAGSHGGGAAWAAYNKFGAIMGQAEGLQGQSYAFPTLNENYLKLPQSVLKEKAQALLNIIKEQPGTIFLITKVGLGIAGYQIYEIAHLFTAFLDIPNCSLPAEFISFIIFQKQSNGQD